MKVSIALATKNGEKYIKEQLDSFNNQTLLPDELIVSDDCSTDKTIEIITKFLHEEAKFPVKIFQNPSTLGVNNNFESALQKCTGDIIFISDQDDRWFESKILEIVELFKENKSIQTIINDQLITNEDLSEVFGSKIQNIKKLHINLEKNFCTGSCTAIKKDWLEFCMPIEGEYDLWINRLSEAYGVRFILEKPLQLFRRHSNNATNWLASSPRKITRLDSFFAARTSQTSDVLRDEVALVQKIIDKFDQEHPLGNDECLDSLRKEQLLLIEYTKDRLDLTKYGYLKRLYRIFFFAFKRKYYLSFGWKSLARDLFYKSKN